MPEASDGEETSQQTVRDRAVRDVSERAAIDVADAAAMARIRAGDAAALITLFDHHGLTACALASRFVGHGPEAEDVVHDVFVAVLTRAQGYRPEAGTVAGWLLTAVRDHARARARPAEHVLGPAVHPPEGRRRIDRGAYALTTREWSRGVATMAADREAQLKGLLQVLEETLQPLGLAVIDVGELARLREDLAACHHALERLVDDPCPDEQDDARRTLARLGPRR